MLCFPQHQNELIQAAVFLLLSPIINWVEHLESSETFIHLLEIQTSAYIIRWNLLRYNPPWSLEFFSWYSIAAVSIKRLHYLGLCIHLIMFVWIGGDSKAQKSSSPIPSAEEGRGSEKLIETIRPANTPRKPTENMNNGLELKDLPSNVLPRSSIPNEAWLQVCIELCLIFLRCLCLFMLPV